MKAVNVLFFVVFLVIGETIAVTLFSVNSGMGSLAVIAAFFLALLAAIAIKVADQWERIVILRLGRFSAVKGPGIFLVIPIIDRAIFVDTRILTMDIPKQQVITKDNVPVSINGVVYFKVLRVDDAVIKVQNYAYAMNQYAQATLRDVIGSMTLDQLLAEREKIGKEVERSVEKGSAN